MDHSDLSETMYAHPAFSDIIAMQEKIMAVNNNPQLAVNPHAKCQWVFTLPPDHLRGKKLLLLTIMGIGVHAVWNGPLGAYYSAYDESTAN